MNDKTDFFYNLDVFDFNYSDERGELADYTVGKSISDHKRRFVSSISINPNKEEEIRIFEELIQLQGSVRGKTIGIDYRLLNDSVIDILKKAYQYHLILGVQIFPNDVKLNKDLYDKFNVDDFSSFLVSVSDIEDDVNLSQSRIDLRVTNQLCDYERIQFERDGKDFDHYNVHVSRKLGSSEIKEFVSNLKNHVTEQIFLDFYEPSYYQEFLKELALAEIPKNVEIVLIGNPLSDAKDCFEDFSKILPNPIRVRFNTCCELNDFYQESPHTEGVSYSSDIEVSGEDSYQKYYDFIQFVDEIVQHIKDENYSPLEAVCYINDYFNRSFQSKDVQENVDSVIHRVYGNSHIEYDNLSDLTSIILRKAGIMCYTYSSEDKRKNIVRIKDPKYQIDQIALLDVDGDYDENHHLNSLNHFLVPIDNDIYNQDSEVISLPTSLVMASPDYYAYAGNSNPTDPIALGIRMLQAMGLGHGDYLFDTKEEEIEFYKTALASSSLTNEISYLDIAKAFQFVRSKEIDYPSDEDFARDNRELVRNLQTRGNDYYVSPTVKILGPPDSVVDVDLFKLNGNSLMNTNFVEGNPQVVHSPRKIQNESKEEYKKYLEEFYQEQLYKKNYLNEGKKNMKEFEEYVVDDLKVDELVFYRDVNDSGRLFANKAVFDRFHIDTPKYVIEIDNGEKIYELNTSHAIDIINNANNKYSPYLIRYCYISITEDRNMYGDNKEEKKSLKDKFIFYRNINDPQKLYVRKEVFDRFHIEKSGKPVLINGIECFEITNEDVLYITGNSKNKYSPYDVEERGIPLDRSGENMDIVHLPYKEKFIIYRNVDHPQMLYVRKEVFKRFHLNTDVEEVIISGIPCYVIDRGDLSYILGNANNSYSPYEIEYRDVKLKTTNIKAAENSDAVDVFRVYRNKNNQEKWYVDKALFDRFHLNTEVEEVIISGIPCYVIDEKDLAYIIGNANNKYSPYRVEFVDLSIKSQNMRPGENEKAVDTIVMYRNISDQNMFFVHQDVFDRFHLQTEVEEIRINGDLYYVIDPDDLEYIIGNANNKFSPYKIEFRDIPIGKLRKKSHDVTAKDLVDSAYPNNNTVKRPRERYPEESNGDYIKYLENFYNEIYSNKNHQYVK